MKIRLSWLTIPVLAVAVAACGDDDGAAVDAGNMDGSTNDGAPAIDAAPSADAFAAACTPTSGTNIGLQLVTNAVTRPVFLTSPANDARLFIIEQAGRIRIVENDLLLTTPFLDITSIVESGGNEQGLLGLAFHPDYANNGRFYVNYTAEASAATPVGNGATVIAEYTASGNTANTTETRLLEIAQYVNGSQRTNHNGGMINFGPDGYLYIGMGDGGSSNDPDDNGQDPSTFLGSMLRIDIDTGSPYGIPPTNPYATSVGSEKKEVFHIGLRNPWRWSFDRLTGDMYIGDVGQGLWEEISFAGATDVGLDFGWDTLEGNDCHEPNMLCNASGTTLPISVYANLSFPDECAVTGGYVYRGACMPDLQGTYFFGDYCSNRVWAFKYVGSAVNSPPEVTADLDPMGLLDGLSGWGQDAAGELYLTSLSGEVYRIIAD